MFSFPNSCKITEKRLWRRHRPTKTKPTQEITTRPCGEEERKQTGKQMLQLMVDYVTDTTDARNWNANGPVMTAVR